MTSPIRAALPVPPLGTALDGSGEAYIASLVIRLDTDDGAGSNRTTGDVLETLLIAVNLRRNGFHPRSFAFQPFGVDGPKFADLLERNWSSIDASGPQVVELANRIVALGKKSKSISFEQVN